MKKKHTAVEFYRTELRAFVSMKESKFQNENEIFEQAKQMEKEQIVEAFLRGEINNTTRGAEPFKNSKTYYNELYGGTQC